MLDPSLPEKSIRALIANQTTTISKVVLLEQLQNSLKLLHYLFVHAMNA